MSSKIKCLIFALAVLGVLAYFAGNTFYSSVEENTFISEFPKERISHKDSKKQEYLWAKRKEINSILKDETPLEINVVERNETEIIISKRYAGSENIPFITVEEKWELNLKAERYTDTELLQHLYEGSKEFRLISFVEMQSDKLLICFNNFNDIDNQIQELNSLGITLVQKFKTGSTMLVSFDPSNNALTKHLNSLALHPSVKYVEPDYIYTGTATPNDPRFDLQWALHNNDDTDIDAPQAWDITTGSNNVTVVVMDSGVDIDHDDLQGNIWVNPNEIPGDGIDNDNNGFVDDIHGWDFIDNNNNVKGGHSHGTAIAGIIGARHNNSFIAGINDSVKIVPVRVLNDNNKVAGSSWINGIEYTLDFDFDIVNISIGGGGYSNTLKNLLTELSNKSLVVCSAGNSGWNIDETPYYPAAYDIENMIVVGASQQNETLMDQWINGTYYGSSYGQQRVDLIAPGQRIETLYNNNSYSWWTGTSFAAPHVAGVAALMKAVNPDISIVEMKQILFETVDKIDEYSDKCATGGRLNAFKAVKRANGTNALPVLSFENPVENSEILAGNNLNVRANANDPDGSIRKVSLYLDNYKVGESATTPYSWSINSSSLNPGFHSLTAEAIDDSGESSIHTINISVTEPDNKEDSVFSDAQIGNSNFEAVHNGNVSTLSAAGSDIWGTSDEFGYSYVEWTGDCTVTVRVENLTNTNSWAKAGIMIRESISGNSKHAMTVVTPSQRVSFQRRINSGGNSTGFSQSGVSTPQWLKMTRVGNSISSFYRADGEDWIPLDTVNIDLPEQVLVGLCLTSHNTSQVAYAQFTNFKVHPLDFRDTLTSGKVQTNQPNSNHWNLVQLKKSYVNPVIIFSPLTYNGSNESTIRVKNVTGTSFEWQIQEWDYHDGYHVQEEVSYVVLEAGTYNLSNGRKLVAGNINSSDSFSVNYFDEAFSKETPPVVISQIISASDTSAAVTRQRNISPISFEIKLQSQESFSQTHGDEKVSFIAIDSGTYNDSSIFSAGTTGSSVTHNWSVVQFSPVGSSSFFFGAMQTYNGSDTAGIRIRNLTNNSVEVKVEEEQSSDDETSHWNENVGFILFDVE